jgi:hypothetical protein
MDLTYSEGSSGINYLNKMFSFASSGGGSFDRKINLYDLDISFLLTNKFAIVAAVRQNSFEQDGTFTADGTAMAADFGFDTLGIEGGLQYQFSPKIGLTAGYRYEGRELENLETVAYEEKTEKHGFFGNLKLTPSRMFNLTFDYQHGSYDEAYTLASPTGLTRMRITAKVRKNDFSVSTSYQYNKLNTEVFEEDTWESSKNQFNLRAGYHGDKIKIFAGYSYFGVENTGQRAIAYPPAWSGGPGTFPWSILYEGKSSIIDGSLSYAFTENWKVGGYFNSYSNSGSWEISRTMLKAYIEYVCKRGLVYQAGYRYVDFEEKSSGSNDYKATIFELSFGYRWK